MAKKSSEYWKKRFEILENAQAKRGAEYFAELEKQYVKASRAVQDDIEKWYARFATDNEITLQEARKLLNSDELEEFKWNVMEYIEKGRTLNVSDQWLKQLKNASAKFHVSRLEALKIQMQNHVEVLYGNEQDDVAKLMEKIYTEGYYHTAYEVQKGFQLGYTMLKLDKKKVEKVLSKPWTPDGSNFSDRIWKQKNQLVTELHNNLTQAIIRGQSPSVVTSAIAKRFNVSRGQAGRLVMTESAFFASVSNRDCYNDLDVEEYEILATLDSKTSEICRELDGKVFKMSEYQAGVTAPPFHVWCRTTTVPYFDDEFELGSERAARGEDGKTYFVPSTMKYQEWYEKFVNIDSDIPDGYFYIKSNNPLSEKAKAIISDKELASQMDKINDLIGDYISSPTNYSGVKIDDELGAFGKTSRKTGRIILRSDAPIKTKVHELLHARTNYDKVTDIDNARNSKLNEALTELIAECICDANGIDFIPTYQKYTKALTNIASTNEDAIGFLLNLFEKPYSTRYNLLEEYVDSITNSDEYDVITKAESMMALATLYGKVKK